ncbi:AAA family ATPase, partial [Janthinobacterium sp. UMAB-60]|uniref:AAA family ATPase n=1 Tax=Janthinobacterium sp. UMAB-60 TaxID=1365365 RepID=UPI0035ABC038
MQTTSSTPVTPTLHLVCGKIASGKSTLTTRLASAPQTVRISEDSLLAQLYPGQIASLAD